MGKVFLVGAGPGDPGLLTVRAAEVIAEASAIVYDEDLPAPLLRSLGGSAERRPVRVLDVDVPGYDATVRAACDETLLAAARHARVVRLCWGDPLAGGAGEEEAILLAEAGADLEIVPGVPVVEGVATYGGVPLADGAADGGVRGAAETQGVWVRSGSIEAALADLGARGLPADAPAVVVRDGTLPAQQTREGTLQSLRQQLRASPAAGPAVVIAGAGVPWRAKLAWAERRPLAGLRVVVTRARAQADSMIARLRVLGAEVVHFPTIRIVPPSDAEPLRRAVREVEVYRWLLFTSVNGVARFWEELRASGGDTRRLCRASICAIGPATAAAVAAEGARADLVPETFVAESVVEALVAAGAVRGVRMLLPRAEVARSVLPESLRALGAELDEVAAYRTVSDAAAAGELRSLLDGGRIDLLLFTASSTVRNFVEAVGAALGGARIATIGPITSATARELGLEVAIEAEKYTVEGLLEAVCAHYAQERERRHR